jgi:hypothetical protein
MSVAYIVALDNCMLIQNSGLQMEADTLIEMDTHL